MKTRPITVSVTGQALIETPVDTESAVGRELRDFFARSDLGFANFEACVETPGAWPTKTGTKHAASETVLTALRRLGIGAVGHANNHAFDFGPPGAVSARAAAMRAGLGFAGSGADLAEAAAPAYCATPAGEVAVIAVDLGPQQDIVYAAERRGGVNPLRMRRVVAAPAAEYAAFKRVAEALGDAQLQRTRASVGMRDRMEADGIEIFGARVVEGPAIAAHWSTAPADLARLKATLAATRARGALTLVSLHSHHWQGDWSAVPDWYADLCRDLIDSGADVIVGTGAPVLQRILFHRGRPIFAGLGNFIFHTKRLTEYDDAGFDVWSGAVCRCRFAADRSCEKIDVLPIGAGRIATGGAMMPAAPARLSAAAAQDALVRLTAGLPAEQRALVALA